MQRSDSRSLRDEILDHSFWYHRIDLGEGFYTPGYVGAEKYLELGLPDDLSGKSVLDIGSYNGLFAFEAERRGADRVLATDLWELDDREDALERDHRRRGFELAREYLDSDVEAESIDLLDISPETVGTFDVVICAGVLYRLRSPIAGIENLVSVADERIVLTTMRPRWLSADVPAMEFYEDAERLSDPTIWWMPTAAGIDGMLRSAGCRRVETSLVPAVNSSCRIRFSSKQPRQRLLRYRNECGSFPSSSGSKGARERRFDGVPERYLSKRCSLTGFPVEVTG